MEKTHLLLVWILTASSAIFAGCVGYSCCPEGQSWCGAMCFDLMTDDDNCGQCGNQCDPHSDCIDGQCACYPDYTICDGRCVNLKFDAENCGVCGNVCPAGGVCNNGICGPGPDCGWGLIDCSGVCVDPMADENHCGYCNNKCRDDQICRGGSCVCVGSFQDCDGECVDNMTNTAHCGYCNNACSPGLPCKDGVCLIGDCSPYEIYCSGECVDPYTNNDHCGGCDNACDTGGGFFCFSGDCECGAGEECVAGVCTNTDTDEQNCGACWNACRADQVCEEGQCGCIEGLTECGDPPVCVDIKTHPVHCGVCDFNCPPEEYCVDGLCRGDCWPWNEMCGSDCVDLQTSNSHCGQCDNPCDVASGFFCQNGVCDCASGLYDCNGECVNLDQDPMNCGSCDWVCTPNEGCVSGLCLTEPIWEPELTCPAGEMSMGMSMQCTAVLHEIGGATIDVTDQVEWYWDECEASGGCVDGPILQDVVDGLVSTVDSGGTIGDMASIYAEYQNTDTSNRWYIRLVEQPSVEDFIAGAVLDPCQDLWEVCMRTAGCILEESEYIEGDFPGEIGFAADISSGETLVVKLFFSTQEDPGTDLTATFYDNMCNSVISQSPGGDLFEEAGLDWTLEISQEFNLDGLHLVEISSDATTHFYLRVEIQ